MKKIFNKIVQGKKGFKQELQKVYMNDKELVATDAYKLIKVDKSVLPSEEQMKVEALLSRLPKKKKNCLIPVETLDLNLEYMPGVLLDMQSTYPEYNSLFPSERKLKDEYRKISVDSKHLQHLLEAINATMTSKQFSHVDIFISKEDNMPIIIKRTDAPVEALLMPIRQ